MSDGGFPPKVFDHTRAELAVTELLAAFGQDVGSDGLKDTPRRVAKAWAEQLGGYAVDTHALLATSFEVPYDEVIALKGIRFTSTCEHHLMPFTGTAAVAYVPPKGGRVVGLSKLARLVDAHAKRLQIQERLTADIAADLQHVLSPIGIAVIIEASHSCMCARGVMKPGAEMVTSSMLGVFRDKPEARAEVLNLLR